MEFSGRCFEDVEDWKRKERRADNDDTSFPKFSASMKLQTTLAIASDARQNNNSDSSNTVYTP